MLFRVGRVHVTREVLECDAIQVSDLVSAFGRYIRGDWGNVDGWCEAQNDVALTSGEPVVAVYESREGQEFWITTSVGTTTVRLPNAEAACALPGRSCSAALRGSQPGR
ncbi:MAG: hypothetical protein K6T30_02925 [Alicyclobacillus sp.]|nr:hypothetical protein [Alicyclobacillus sp.]